MHKHLRSLVASLAVIPAALVALPARAQNLVEAGANLGKTGLGGTGDNPVTSGASSDRLFVFIGYLINIAFGLLGIIFVGLTLYAGWLWMTAQGDTKQVDKAKSVLTQAIIGLVILVLAYSITGFVMNALARATAA